MKLDYIILNCIFKTDQNTNLRKVRSKSKERSWSIMVMNLINLHQYASTYEV